MLLKQKTEFQKLENLFYKDISLLEIKEKTEMALQAYSPNKVFQFLTCKLSVELSHQSPFDSSNVIYLSALMVLPKQVFIDNVQYLSESFDKAFMDWFIQQLPQDVLDEFIPLVISERSKGHLRSIASIETYIFVHLFVSDYWQDYKKVYPNSLLEKMFLNYYKHPLVQKTLCDIYKHIVQNHTKYINDYFFHTLDRLHDIILKENIEQIQEELLFVMTNYLSSFTDSDSEYDEDGQPKNGLEYISYNEILNGIVSNKFYNESILNSLIDILNSYLNSGNKIESTFKAFFKVLVNKNYIPRLKIETIIYFMQSYRGITDCYEIIPALKELGFDISAYEEQYVKDMTEKMIDFRDVKDHMIDDIFSEDKLDYYYQLVISNPKKYHYFFEELCDKHKGDSFVSFEEHAKNKEITDYSFSRIYNCDSKIKNTIIKLFAHLSYQNDKAYKCAEKMLKTLVDTTLLDLLIKQLPHIDSNFKQEARKKVLDSLKKINMGAIAVAKDVYIECIAILIPLLDIKEDNEIIQQAKELNYTLINQKIIQCIISKL